MKQKSFSAKALLACLISYLIFSTAINAQVPPPGKYNTSNYPEDRIAIEQVNQRMDSTQFLNDDYIAVGPEGKVSFGFEQWGKHFSDNKVTFKSVTPVPGTYTLRIYNGDAAVRFVILDVVFDTPKGELALRVIRTETYIKQSGKWFFVSGQGTLVMSEEDKKKLAEPAVK